MFALTVRQPWASLIVFGHKTLDSRGFNTFYRGPVAIHASNSTGGLEWADACAPLQEFLREHGFGGSVAPLGVAFHALAGGFYRDKAGSGVSAGAAGMRFLALS